MITAIKLETVIVYSPLKTAVSALIVLVCTFLGNSLWANAKPEAKVKIDAVYFFGYEGLDLVKIKEGMALKAGAEVDQMDFLTNSHNYFKKLEAELKKPITDSALVNIGNNRTVVFVGLPGNSTSPRSDDNSARRDEVPVPKDIEAIYDAYIVELPLYLRNRDKTILARMTDLTERLKRRSSSKRKELRKSLQRSGNSKDRAVAAYALGLVATDKADFDVLARAAQDPNAAVRNNAIRELAERLQESPRLASKLSSTAIARYVDMLNSPTWTDRNKAAFLLTVLSKDRDPKLLNLFRDRSLASLKEMLSWPDMYWSDSLTLIGRIGGIPEQELEKLLSNRDCTGILKSLNKRPGA